MLLEPNLFPGKEHFPCMDIHPPVKGGPHLCQGLAHLQNPGGVLLEIHGWVLKEEIKDILIWQDHTRSASSWPHLCKPKKFRGLGTHSGYQKSLSFLFFFFGCATPHAGSYLPHQGSYPCSLHWKHRVPTTGPGNSQLPEVSGRNQPPGREFTFILNNGCEIFKV